MLTHPIIHIIKLFGVQNEVWKSDHVIDGIRLEPEMTLYPDFLASNAKCLQLSCFCSLKSQTNPQVLVIQSCCFLYNSHSLSPCPWQLVGSVHPSSSNHLALFWKLCGFHWSSPPPVFWQKRWGCELCNSHCCHMVANMHHQWDSKLNMRT